MSSEEEWESEVVALRAEIEELRDRVTDLEIRVGSGHNCTLDVCLMDWSRGGRCLLAPCDHEDIDDYDGPAVTVDHHVERWVPKS